MLIYWHKNLNLINEDCAIQFLEQLEMIRIEFSIVKNTMLYRITQLTPHSRAIWCDLKMRLLNHSGKNICFISFVGSLSTISFANSWTSGFSQFITYSYISECARTVRIYSADKALALVEFQLALSIKNF